jgi:thiamine-phosphate pyrophosphorylase
LTPTPDPRSLLTLITDDALTPERTLEAVEKACHAVPLTVQLRAREWSGRAFHAAAERLREATRRAGCRFVVHDRIDVAAAVAADGVHLPSTGIAPRRARELMDARFGVRAELGVSVHSESEIAALAGVADYVHFGPVFATASKERFGPPQGMASLSNAAARVRVLGSTMRLIGVGGITAANARLVIDGGADGIAVMGAVMRAADPASAARAIADALRRARA